MIPPCATPSASLRRPSLPSSMRQLSISSSKPEESARSRRYRQRSANSKLDPYSDPKTESQASQMQLLSDEGGKRARALENNRIAARKCRRSKATQLEKLLLEADEFRCEIQNLRAQNYAQQLENQQLWHINWDLAARNWSHSQTSGKTLTPERRSSVIDSWNGQVASQNYYPGQQTLEAQYAQASYEMEAVGNQLRNQSLDHIDPVLLERQSISPFKPAYQC